MKIVEKINTILNTNAYEVYFEDIEYPAPLKLLPDAPKKLYVLGNLCALVEGISIVGARQASPYGLSCAEHFSSIASKAGIVVISGGAIGCDSAAHRAALKNNCKTVVFVGGGANCPYPARNVKMYQEVIDKGGAIVSEQDWNFKALPYTFLLRNRLIAGMSKATLIVEAGMPSGTFSTADFALKYNKDVLAVPGSITSSGSAGCNHLIFQGALPIINDEVFCDYLFENFELRNTEFIKNKLSKKIVTKNKEEKIINPILKALLSQAMSIDELYKIACMKSGNKNPSIWLSEKLVDAEQSGRIKKYANGMYGPVVIDK